MYEHLYSNTCTPAYVHYVCKTVEIMGFIPPAILVMLAACMHGSLVNTSMLLNDSKGSGE